MGLLHWLDHWLASLERALVVLLLTGLLGLGLLQVIERNVLASGIFWADELLQHLVLWLGFLGASLATREQRHLSIDVLSHFLPTRWQLWLGLLVNIDVQLQRLGCGSERLKQKGKSRSDLSNEIVLLILL